MLREMDYDDDNDVVLCPFQHYLILVLLNPDIPWLCKLCRSEEANWSGSALFAIHYVNFYQQSGLRTLIGLQL